MLPNLSNPPQRRFISEDPRTPKYTARLTIDDKERLEPLLRRLHEEVASREVMLQESRIEIGKPLTFHQLDGLRNTFGLHTYRQLSSRATVHGSEEISSQRPSSSAQAIAESDSGGSLPSTNPCSLTTKHLRCDVTQDKQPYGEIPPELIDMDIHMCYDDPAVEDGHLSEDILCTQPRSEVSSATSQSVVDVYGELDESSRTDATEEASSSIQERDQAPKCLSDGDNYVDDLATPATTDEKALVASANPSFPNFENLDRFEIRLDALPGRHPAATYSPLIPALEIYSMAVTRSDTGTESIARLNQAANLLRSLRAFDQAFDIYLFIFCHFREVKSTAGPPHPQFVLAAINCARCSQTGTHIRVSNKILQDVQQRLETYYEFSRLLWMRGSTHPWRYLETLSQRFLPIMTGISKNLLAETIQDTAYWAACAIAISQSQPARAHDLVWDSILPFRHESVLQHFHDCQIIRHVLLNALQKMQSWVRRNPSWLNTLFGRSWRPSDTKLKGFAQALSCFLLEDHLEMAGFAEVSPIEHDVDDHLDFPCDLGGQAVAVIPYVLVEWIQPLGSPGSLLRNKIQFVTALKDAMDDISDSVRLSGSNYEKFIDLCLKTWGTPTTLKPAEAHIVSPDRLRKIAAATAGLMSSVDVVAAAKAENARKGLSMREPITEHQGIELVIDRLSISSAPTLTGSYTSSNSSDYRLFSRLRNSISASLNTRSGMSSDRSSSRGSLRFSRATGLPSDPPSLRSNSISTISSDITMTTQ